MKKQFLLSCFWILFALLGFTQAMAQHKVTGRVVDASGEPLPGVNIVEKGTYKGVITNFDGEYIIEVSGGNKVLSFSFIGFTAQDVPVQNRTNINVTLEEEVSKLDEVVVVGYGIQKRTSVTGSVANISNKELKEAPVANLSTVLAGRLPGLVSKQSSGQPGADDAQLFVRGLATTGNNSPTIIVDGVQRTFSNLDPNEIESVTILKDAAAAAVYGVQGANGVILVTTKRGASEKAKISYTGNMSFSTNTRMPEFLNGPDYAYWYNKALEMDGKEPLFDKDAYDKIVNGDPDGIYGNTDWFDLLFNDYAPSVHHNLSVSGGTESTKYFVSLGYLDQDGIVDNISFKRYNLRSNLDVKLNDNLKFSIDLAARQEKREKPYFSTDKGSFNNLVQQAARALPIIPQEYQGMPTATLAALSSQNPVAARDMSGYNHSLYNIFQSTTTLSYDVPGVDGLNLKVLFGYDRDYTNSKVWKTPYQLMVFSPDTETYSKTEANIGLPIENTLSEGFGDAARYTFQPTINYINTFGKHDVGALLVYEQSKHSGKNISASVMGFDLTTIQELSLGKDIMNNKKADAIAGGSYETPRAGFVGRFNYAFDQKYLVEFASRYDGSSNFPSETRWGFFPAVSVGWRVSEEGFFSGVKGVIDNLKLRASAGKLGNDRINANYAYLKLMQLTDKPVGYFGDDTWKALYTSNMPNYDITWETTNTYNAGFELMVKQGLLGVEFDWFYKVTKDILMGTGGVYPPSLGGNYPAIINSGVVDNRGFELVLTHTKKINDFRYNLRGNVSWSRNKIIKIDDSPNIPDYQKRVGRRLGEKMGFIAEGLFQSEEEILGSAVISPNIRPGDIKYRDLNGDGKISDAQDYTFMGNSSIPELMFGLNMNMSYKAFDFSALFQGAAIADLALSGVYSEYEFPDNTQYTRPFYNGGNVPYYLVEDSWTPENRDAKYTRLTTTVPFNNNGWASSWWLRDASYLRLKNMQIGYTLPKAFLNRFGIESLRLSLSGTNIFTWSGLEYIDPEAPDVNNGYYPQQRTFNFGVNVTL